MPELVRRIVGSAWTLLISLVAVLLFYGLFEETATVAAISLGLLTVALLSATFQMTAQKGSRSIPLVLLTCAMGSKLFYHIKPDDRLHVVSSACVAAFFLYTSVRTLAYILRRGKVTSRRIVLAVCLYLMLGFTWFSIYEVTELLRPGAFSWTNASPAKPVNAGDLIYFSLATLTTVGYGDIVATRPLSRIIAVLEACTGVLYVGVLIARLVSGYQSEELE
jgi:voltage-gated potassium channel